MTASHQVPADTAELDVTVVLPVHNEHGHLRTEIDRIRATLEASPYASEVVVVDDGSDDGSGEQLRRIEGIRHPRFAQNRGSSSACKAGTRAARGRVIVWTDTDLTYPNDEIPSSRSWMAATRFAVSTYDEYASNKPIGRPTPLTMVVVARGRR